MHDVPEPTRKVMTGAIVAGPVILAAGTLAGIAGDGLFRDAWQGGINVIASGVWAIGFVALALTLAQRAPRLGTVMLLVGTPCLVTGAAWGVDYMAAAVHGVRFTPEMTPAFLLVMIPGVLFPPILAATAIGLWRTGAVPAAAGLTLALGAVFFPLGRVPEIASLAILSDVLLVAGSALVAAALRHRSPLAEPMPVIA